MTQQTLTVPRIIALGFMTFAFFLGAGNIIIPPLAGQQAGDHWPIAAIAFLLTAVGLPLATLIAVATANGGLPVMTKWLPKPVAVLLTVTIYILIGPAVATPRTAMVANGIGFTPIVHDLALAFPQLMPYQDWAEAVFPVLFFIVVIVLAQHRGQLIDRVGKILTPILLVLLAILGGAVLFMPQGPVGTSTGGYIEAPFSTGFVSGYNTMDTFGALMFGMLIIDVLRKQQITDHHLQRRYLIIAGLIAAGGLMFVYGTLFLLGATSGTVIPNADSGDVVITHYVAALFGDEGQWILGGVVMLACLTTAVGLISACGDYFSKLVPTIGYRAWVIIFSVLCAIVAHIDLKQLFALSGPVLIALYPVAIALVMLTFLKPWLRNPDFAFRSVMLVAFIISLVDGINATGLHITLFKILPGAEQSMGWIAPVLVTLLLNIRWSKRPAAEIEGS